jgi:hypothetical protein
MSGCSSVSTAAGFIDLATFSEPESFMYGGPHAISHFVAGVQKANWFTIVPIQLRNNGTFDFGQCNVSACLNRSGDYVLNVWFRCQIPSIAWNNGTTNDGSTVRWTRNLMHNLIRKCNITFNELVVEEFDHYWLDFNYMFRIPANKRVGYKNMIGDISTLTTGLPTTATFATIATNGALWGGFFSVPLPFWFQEDSGIALPVAALPFNDVKINYEFRTVAQLLVFNNPFGGVINNSVSQLTFFFQDFSASTGTITTTTDTTQSFMNGYTYAHYAVIHNDERVKMGDAPRDMLIRQVQCVQGSDVITSATDYYQDIRLSHGIVNMFFALRNKTYAGEWSNYTTSVNYGTVGNGFVPNNQGWATPYWDPIDYTALIYENTTRLWFDSDFYSLINPWYFSEAIPDETGYHWWTYSVKAWDPLGPSGSTNYSKLANVQIRHHLSNRAQYYLNNALTPTGSGTFGPGPIKLHGVFVAQNWNIARSANGSLGHPTL